MAISGRSYASVPVISRGSLEDPSDFRSGTRVLVIAAQVDRRWLTAAPAVVSAAPQQPAAAPAAAGTQPVITVPWPARPPAGWAFTGRSTLQDPPLLTTPQPVVVAAPYDQRWYARSQVTVAAAPQAPPGAPGPVVVAAQPPRQAAAQASVIRATLTDPPVLTTPQPLVIAAQYDRRQGAAGQPVVIAAPQPQVTPVPLPVVTAAQPDARWRAQSPAIILSAPRFPGAPANGAPAPLVIAAQPQPRAASPAITLRAALAGPAVLITAGPLVVARPYDRRWYCGAVVFTASGSPLAAPPPLSGGVLTASGIV